MINEYELEDIVSTIIDMEMQCKKYLMCKNFMVDLISEYYYVDDDYAVISFSRNNDRLTIRIENQECHVSVENQLVEKIETCLDDEDIKLQIEILIKQLLLGKWQKFLYDANNSSLLEAVQMHGFDDYSDGPDAVIYY